MVCKDFTSRSNLSSPASPDLAGWVCKLCYSFSLCSKGLSFICVKKRIVRYFPDRIRVDSTSHIEIILMIEEKIQFCFYNKIILSKESKQTNVGLKSRRLFNETSQYHKISWEWMIWVKSYNKKRQTKAVSIIKNKRTQWFEQASTRMTSI